MSLPPDDRPYSMASWDGFHDQVNNKQVNKQLLLPHTKTILVVVACYKVEKTIKNEKRSRDGTGRKSNETRNIENVS